MITKASRDVAVQAISDATDLSKHHPQLGLAAIAAAILCLAEAIDKREVPTR